MNIVLRTLKWVFSFKSDCLTIFIGVYLQIEQTTNLAQSVYRKFSQTSKLVFCSKIVNILYLHCVWIANLEEKKKESKEEGKKWKKEEERRGKERESANYLLKKME